jgi:hypothetical protein
MALGLTFSNGKPAPMGRGKYQTRNNRLVEITGSRIVSGTTAGTPWTKTVWDGDLYQSDLKAVETRATWSNDGGYLHEEGVGNSLDLMTVITQEAEPAAVATAVGVPANDPAVLENQILCAALVEELNKHSIGADVTSLDTLRRIVDERDTAQRHVQALLANPVA